MFFYFVYEILIKKYNVQIVKDLLEYDVNVKKYYPLEEIVIKNSKTYWINFLTHLFFLFYFF